MSEKFQPHNNCISPHECAREGFCRDVWHCATQRRISDQMAATPAAVTPPTVAPRLIDQYPILRYFHYEHLPPHLRAISAPFCELAVSMCHMLPRNAETSTMLRKLLEAKDCAVRANVTDKDHPAPKEAR
jgi:hypothetical protein